VSVVLPGFRRRDDGKLEPHPTRVLVSRAEAIRRLRGHSAARQLEESPHVAVVALMDDTALAKFLSPEELRLLGKDGEEWLRQEGKAVVEGGPANANPEGDEPESEANLEALLAEVGAGTLLEAHRRMGGPFWVMFKADIPDVRFVPLAEAIDISRSNGVSPDNELFRAMTDPGLPPFSFFAVLFDGRGLRAWTRAHLQPLPGIRDN
jgi:hypothetical protein